MARKSGGWFRPSIVLSLEYQPISTRYFAIIFLHGLHHHPNSHSKLPDLHRSNVISPFFNRKWTSTQSGAPHFPASYVSWSRSVVRCFFLFRKNLSHMKIKTFHFLLNVPSSKQHSFSELSLFLKPKKWSLWTLPRQNHILESNVFTWLAFTFWNQIKPIPGSSGFVASWWNFSIPNFDRANTGGPQEIPTKLIFKRGVGCFQK